MLTVAQNAVLENPELRKVVIMEHAPRQDPPDVDPTKLKPKLAKLANSTLAQLVQNSGMQSKIIIGKHSLETKNLSSLYRDDLTSMYDGVHMYSRHGKDMYTRSVTSVINSVLPANTINQYQSRPLYSHVTCPQAQYQRKQQARAELNQEYTVPVNNRFSVLGN